MGLYLIDIDLIVDNTDFLLRRLCYGWEKVL